ncbi:hypothetical protein PDB1_05782 [Pseudomonas aeruginosa]
MKSLNLKWFCYQILMQSYYFHKLQVMILQLVHLL